MKRKKIPGKITCEKFHDNNCDCEMNHIVHEDCEISPMQTPDCELMDMRLNRAIATAGVCSRRKADSLIISGQIEVNGLKQTNPGTRVSSGDSISLNGSPITRRQQTTTLILNKPIKVICTASDPQKRTTVLDLLPRALRKLRLFPVGRLDYFSEGLLVLTNNGDLAFRLSHPSLHVIKIYEVIIRGSIPESALDAFRTGMTLADGKKLRPVGVEISPLTNGDTLMRMELHEGINRQIRRMCEAFDLVILKLKRIAQGPIKLGNLKPGQFRVLSQSELANLHKATLASSCAPSAS